MKIVVVDASVVVKWYIPEQDHKSARALRDDFLAGDHLIKAPALLPFEVINALKYSGHYEGDRLIQAANTLPEYSLDLIPFAECGPVGMIADALDITIYDASYLALGEDQDSVVYTADSTLIDDTADSDYENRRLHIRDYPSAV